MSARALSLFVALAALIVAVAAGAGWWLSRGAPGTGGSGTALIGGPFELVDHRGNAMRDDAFRGRLLLVYFGYTYCPDVCPTELSNLTQALDLLGQDANDVQPLFITVDPERDTVPVLAEYVQHFHESIVGLTGSAEQVAAAAKAYRIYYAKAERGSEGGYLMDHSSFVYLMDREGRYARHFGPNTAPDKIAEAIRAAL